MQNQNDKTKPDHIIRVGVFPSYIILFLVVGSLVYPLMTTPNLAATLIIGSIVAWLLYYFNSLNISIFDDRLVFKKKNIPFSGVRKITMNVDLNVKTPSGKRVPVYGICFFDASGNDEPLAIIPTKVFDKKDLIYLMHIITKNNPSIQLDSLSQDLSVGNFGTIAKIGLTNVLTWFIRLMVISLLLRVFIALLFRRSL